MKDYELTHIRMTQEEPSASGKTLIWGVRTKSQSPKDPQGEGGTYLGHVKWFGRWRGYSFFPYIDTIYEQKCLREIADFVEARSKEHRASKRKAKKRT